MKSEFIRESLTLRNMKPVNSPATIMKIVHEHHEFICTKMKAEISETLASGQRYSATLDEYTSLANKRYLNLNAHCQAGNFFNLGLLNLTGNITAERIVSVVKNRLVRMGSLHFLV